jgi:hypothetical protein
VNPAEGTRKPIWLDNDAWFAGSAHQHRYGEQNNRHADPNSQLLKRAV